MPPGLSSDVRVAVDDLTLSGLYVPPPGVPRATLLALHGHAMTSAYFDGPADPSTSLLTLGASLGFAVWAPDRPGYGTSRGLPADRLEMNAQAELLLRAMDRFAETRDIGAGWILVGHSFGLKLALTMAAANTTRPILGVDGSGTGLRYAFDPGGGPPPPVPGDAGYSYGPAHLYPPATFERGGSGAVRPAAIPVGEGTQWPEDFVGFASRLTLPVRIVYGDHERVWHHGDAEQTELRALLGNVARLVIDVQIAAGHNVSLAHVGRAYHLRVLAFAEECLAAVAPAATDRGDGSPRRG